MWSRDSALKVKSLEFDVNSVKGSLASRCVAHDRILKGLFSIRRRNVI